MPHHFTLTVSEAAQLYGIPLDTSLSRGSQFKVEAILLRAAKQENYLALSATPKAVRKMPIIKHIPLVLEPVPGLQPHPIIVLDFRSLYPSIAIAYNLWSVAACLASFLIFFSYTTCLGFAVDSETRPLGFSTLHVPRRDEACEDLQSE